MRIQIDTTAKTIRVEEQVKLTELFSMVKKLLPETWKEYSLEQVAFTYWGNPILLPFSQTEPFEITCGELTTTTNSGVFCIDAN